jgi:hypothetical protein
MEEQPEKTLAIVERVMGNRNNADKYTIEELKKRNFLRLARLIYDLWDEGRGNPDQLKTPFSFWTTG